MIDIASNVATEEPVFIAEVKTVSPFGYRSEKSWDELFSLAEKEGDWISIHTDARWGGGFDLIRKARSLTKKPILAKGIHGTDVEIARAIEAGADHVLVVGRIPKAFEGKLLIEPLNLDGLRRIPKQMKAVWNSRDLSTGGKKRESFAEARAAFGGWLCQASGISRIEHVCPGADAILVGECLESFVSARSGHGGLL